MSADPVEPVSSPYWPRVRTSVLPGKRAIKLIGGQRAFNTLHARFAASAKDDAPSRLSLAVSVTSRHFKCDEPGDLNSAATAKMSLADRTHIAFDLNNEDGPWAVAMSQNTLAWATLCADDLSKLKTVGDFLDSVFMHLK